jgi:hypothetical protein
MASSSRPEWDGVFLAKFEGNGCLSVRWNGACGIGVLAVEMHKSHYASHAKHATMLHRSELAIVPGGGMLALQEACHCSWG